MKNVIISIVILMTASAYAQAQSNPASAVPPSAIAPGGAAPAAVSPENQKELEVLRAQAAQLKNQISLLQDRINTYKSWFGHPMTAAQRQETNDKIEATKEQMVPYQTQLAAVQAKIKTLDPTAAAAASPGASPGASAWPFSH